MGCRALWDNSPDDLLLDETPSGTMEIYTESGMATPDTCAQAARRLGAWVAEGSWHGRAC